MSAETYTREQIESGEGLYYDRWTVIWQLGDEDCYLALEKSELPRDPLAHIAGGGESYGDGHYRLIWV